MSERRPLIEGLKPVPANDPRVEKEFVFGGRERPIPPVERTVAVPVRAPLTTRIRADYVAALKRASLTRQLDGQIPNSVQEFLEEALEPWLRSHGYIP
ncbi:Uncharacterized protein OS=Rhodopirellula europaea 6C GN=RE6C_04423 PE=4 SV=1 [Gemmata massiliana]|uniref:Uncharacterized protein n=1 Tax=Gemmata massiliana TaxID=1210884 RepID=A0A6P2DFZ6_9BACT|nr:hypothetical protein [Gemmata massiliana]VTS00602.1 Uncharacterized protein OS=Rhodopirellula europaea 6C GN=RE6C_04423 PE=4 SV=1 [Gemmata massiliana]